MKIKFVPRDFINIGIFAALYFVLMFAGAMIGIIGPVAWLVGFLASALVNGVTVMLFFTRIKSFGVFTVFGLIIALLMGLMGHPPQSYVAAFLFALIADLVALAGRYRNRWLNALAYATFALWPFGYMTMLLYNREGFMAEVAKMGEEYLQSTSAIFTNELIVAWMFGQFIAGALGALLGILLTRKHFAKAGLA